MAIKKNPAPIAAAPDKKLGLRERGKLDKINRIRQAALHLFETKGYEATTTREIAEMADVGIGTVFIYADDKRDLLFLLFNDMLDQIVDGAFTGIDTQLPLSVQVHQVLSRLYVAFHQKKALARILLKELVFFQEGKQVGQYLANRRRLIAGIETLTRGAIDNGLITTEEDPALIANAFFFLYSGEIRLWLSVPEPNLAQGLERLQRMFSLMAHGLGETVQAKPGARVKRSAASK